MVKPEKEKEIQKCRIRKTEKEEGTERRGVVQSSSVIELLRRVVDRSKGEGDENRRYTIGDSTETGKI